MVQQNRGSAVPGHAPSCRPRYRWGWIGFALMAALLAPLTVLGQTQAENGSSPYPTAPRWEPTPPPPPPVYAPLSLPPRSFGSGSLKPFLRFKCDEISLDGSRAPSKEDVLVRRGRVFFFNKDWPSSTPADDTYFAVFGYDLAGGLTWRFGHNEGIWGGTENIEANVSNEELLWMDHSSAFQSYQECHCTESSENAYRTVGLPNGFDWSLGLDKAMYHFLTMNLPPAEFFRHHSYDEAKQWIIARHSTVDGGKRLPTLLSILEEAYADAKRGGSRESKEGVVRFKVPDPASESAREVTAHPAGADGVGNDALSPRMERYFSGKGPVTDRSATTTASVPKSGQSNPAPVRPDWLK